MLATFLVYFQILDNIHKRVPFPIAVDESVVKHGCRQPRHKDGKNDQNGNDPRMGQPSSTNNHHEEDKQRNSENGELFAGPSSRIAVAVTQGLNNSSGGGVGKLARRGRRGHSPNFQGGF